MRFVADLHVHSRYSRATSREADLAGFSRWARIKGIDVVGTGDFTHPRWFEELSANLVEDNGLYRLREPPPEARGTGAPVRFMLTTEISTIYKKNGQVRKVHSLLCVPSLSDVARLTVKLAAIGNIASDGRPILGLDPKDLLSILLETSPEGFLIPAHIWTPWFSIFGSRSGFDAIEECFEELTPHIFALETGLSSDPLMNWRWSALDRYRLVSNSDAHSPGNLGREANLFSTDPSWTGVKNALRTGEGFLGTLEFYPEEGKYHFDGHRKCGVCMDPEETARSSGLCPVCGKPLTIGVLNRVLDLADRDAPAQPRESEGFRYIIPLPELLAELAGTGTGSNAVGGLHARVLAGFGTEYAFLLDAPVRDIERSQGPLLAEAVRRMREGRVDPRPGYDGEFGTIRVFDDAELARLRGQDELFPVAARAHGRADPRRREHGPALPDGRGRPAGMPLQAGAELDAEQRSIVEEAGARSIVFAGPGTGKTRLLAAWIARHAGNGALALTFTNKAARELSDRLAAAAPGLSQRVMTSTFHSLCWSILRESDPSLTAIITPGYRAALVQELLPGEKPGVISGLCDLMEQYWEGMVERDALPAGFMGSYETELRRMGAADIGSLVSRALSLLRGDTGLRAELSVRYRAIAVDELQDINRPQYELLRLLCAKAERVLGIGDPDQSIYGFRGSDRDLLYQFRADGGARSFSLARNYRSTAAIVDAAEALIAGERTPGIPPLASARGPGERIRVVRAADPVDEGRFIASAVRDLVGGVDAVSVDAARGRRPGGGPSAGVRPVGRTPPGSRSGEYAFTDVAVLFRTRAVRDALLPGLSTAGLPLCTGTGAPLSGEEPFRSLAAALRLLAAPDDRVSLRLLLAHARLTRGEAAVERFRERRLELARAAEDRGIAAVMNELVSSVVTVDVSDPAVALGLETLKAAAEGYGSDLQGFLAHISLCARESEGPRAAQKIALLTFHAAKGLEFPVVFIAGAEEGITPGHAAARPGSPRELAEERRLFYVAATRARDMLFVSHCARRRVHGQLVPAAPSRFLADIPSRCRIDQEGRARARDTQLPLFG